MTKLAILGSGGHGVIAADCAERMGRYQEIVFLDDNPALIKDKHLPFHCIGACTDFDQQAQDYEFFVAFGNAQTRETWCSKILAADRPLATLIHPSSSVSVYATIARGVIVCAGAVVNPCAEIGQGAIINTLAGVDHDCYIGAYAHICPGVNLAGNVTIGKSCWIGIGTCVIQGVTVHDNAFVGAGAAVVNDIAENQRVVGVPAKPL